VPEEPRLFADAVSIYSKVSAANSLYAGLHFEPLARFLQQPYEAHAPNIIQNQTAPDARCNYEFVTFYNLNPSSREITHIHSIKDFETQATKLLDQSDHGQLLFMRGTPSPEWLLAIATKCHVDPVFFHRHLDFQHGSPDYFEFPSLPSTTMTMIRLRVTTIGRSMIDSESDPERQQFIEALRGQNEQLLNTYHEKLRANHKNLNLGDSIVRECSVYDTRHFAIEQDISIWVGRLGKAWIGKHHPVTSSATR